MNGASREALAAARERLDALTDNTSVDAARLADELAAAGATCRVTSPIALQVDLPASATPQLVFAAARTAGLQVRELGVRRESVEAAFLRVLGEDGPARGAAPGAHGGGGR